MRATISAGQRAALVDLGGLRRDLALREIARGLQDERLLFGQIEIHALLRGYWRYRVKTAAATPPAKRNEMTRNVQKSQLGMRPPCCGAAIDSSCWLIVSGSREGASIGAIAGSGSGVG